MIDLNIGRLIAQRYQLQELIGTGAMGQVYLANDLLLGGVPVAIKFLALSIQNNKIRVQERFEREAKTCALLGQKNIHIVRVMDYGVDEKSIPYYVMEYLQGESLSDVVRSQPIPLRRFLSFARQLCLGLQAAHEGIPVDGELCPIIHRDIKPSNVLVLPNPSFGELVKILDFGIAKLLQSNSTETNYYLGTWAYSSPEQIEGKELDNRSDIYSLGVMMFEMLTGKMPVKANTNSFGGWYKAHHFHPPHSFRETNPLLELPQELEDLVMSCLAKNSRDRPQNISEILQTITSLEQLDSSIQLSTLSNNKNLASQPTAIPQNITEKERLFTNTGSSELPSWPKNKPIADIVFPHPIHVHNQLTAALWVMLPKQEIEKRLQGTRYNQFLFLNAPHPMILWLTVLHSHDHTPKWLPYYLDLKSHQGLELARLLLEIGYYKILLFTRESPQRAFTCLQIEIAPAQRQLLQQWMTMSQCAVSTASPQFSRGLLKKELEKIKPQVMMKLAAVYKT
ncbi:serine/threonine-protein kinase [Gloeocapsopsis dulcis]|uniref:Serine/threonine protein kinase n=1 Tax=Gloeocapsopsis dulcis AAB1 = 1H9 TaxID=1433147 RepID=A0A6N8G0D1_9CHRO|nr:serine/threonine-protein kinase [Gloeocapsopsis dulcis]MUL38840.1 serine/threonine protein kinase [Gloeocapsopsis dulcis AAB1 = 1H9]WNN91221.1 serine/threonine-protein kinase [Gloeocapsopsis dulcis]